MIQVKVIESDSISSLTEETNQFLSHLDERDVVDVKFQSNIAFTTEEQLESFSVMVIYCVRPDVKVKLK